MFDNMHKELTPGLQVLTQGPNVQGLFKPLECFTGRL